ncbi:nucleotidyl transferase AbiEii/AbiGii toxin family protein [Marinicella gelatinilytica]|uniref:nucleotidyl transferase AbiEii/AbiGii toxin family protein n=1 Tax=Marinicella gelatinilytica TaxID=2996017 RepID=UPI002260EA7B|nr:nucleotidyl transferase AbiEii/AbiGii toxin family protein [Marinicella gelatinilytica]MCX7545502.1 nucleotidyl transferase AbiEii/AbiGii toxin family protein [Marinicella gelatinilytica]
MVKVYQQQVKLVIQLLGLVDTETCFALKGGTAINLFVEDLPRLSVDIDLVYLPDEARNEALDRIREALDRLAEKISEQWQMAQVIKAYDDKNDALRLVVQHDGVVVKVELSPVLRGTVYEPKRLSVMPSVEDRFGYAEMNVVSKADLYAGKMCAALDRQHPRDLFDVMLYFRHNEWDTALRKAFLLYLISHPRPISELLNPHLKPLNAVFDAEFNGMAFVEVSLDELIKTRQQLIDTIMSSLTGDERKFLLSFQNSQADWSLLGLDAVDRLPAIQWKMLNIKKMTSKKLTQELETLKNILGID